MIAGHENTSWAAPAQHDGIALCEVITLLILISKSPVLKILKSVL
jgi:hypothetical protein